MRNENKSGVNILNSTDADMQKILTSVSKKVAASVKKANEIHQERLLKIRVRHAAS